MTSPNPSHPQIVILGYSEAAMFLRGPDCYKVTALISIYGSREFGVEWIGNRLDLTFDDAETPDPSDIVAAYQARMRRQAREQEGLHEVPPTIQDARAIIEFARQLQNTQGIVLCHCGGGVSRAPAAAILCLATWLGSGRESEAVELVKGQRNCAMPHEGLVRLGDEVLQRAGKLLAASGLNSQSVMHILLYVSLQESHYESASTKMGQ